MTRHWTLLFFIGLLQTANLSGARLDTPTQFVHDGTTYEIVRTKDHVLEVRVKNNLEPDQKTPPPSIQVFSTKNSCFQTPKNNDFEETNDSKIVLADHEIRQFHPFSTILKTSRPRAFLHNAFE